MIKYKKPISVSKKFQYGGTVTMGADYAPDMLEWLSRAWEGFKDWNRASAASTGRAVSSAIPKVTPIARTVSKVAGPIGIASMILTPAQANVGEDEWMRKLRGTQSLADLAVEEPSNSSTEQTEVTSSSSTATSNPKDNDDDDDDDELLTTSRRKIQQKKRKNNSDPEKIRKSTGKFWENRANWWETKNNSTASGVTRGLYNAIRGIGYATAINYGLPLIVGLSGKINGIDVQPVTRVTDLFVGDTTQTNPIIEAAQKQQKAVLDSLNADNINRETQRIRDSINRANTPIQFNYSDTTQNRQMLDSIQKLEQKRNIYGL